MYVYMFIYIYIYTHTHIHTYIHIHMYICKDIWSCACGQIRLPQRMSPAFVRGNHLSNTTFLTHAFFKRAE